MLYTTLENFVRRRYDQDIKFYAAQWLDAWQGFKRGGKIWIQGESVESLKQRALIVNKFRERKIKLNGSILIGRHCQIDDGVTIIDSCIDNYCKIGKDVTIENSAVLDRVIIGEGATIRKSIIGRQVTINSTFNKPTKVEHFSVIADDVVLAPGCYIHASKVYPHLSLPEGKFERMTVKSIVVTS